MITAERKPMEELTEYVKNYERILLVGCNECVTVCAAGGRKEVALLASALQMDAMQKGKTLDIKEITLERQCDPEYIEELTPHIDRVDAVMPILFQVNYHFSFCQILSDDFTGSAASTGHPVFSRYNFFILFFHTQCF